MPPFFVALAPIAMAMALATQSWRGGFSRLEGFFLPSRWGKEGNGGNGWHGILRVSGKPD